MEQLLKTFRQSRLWPDVMGRRAKRRFVIAAAYDTETTNIGKGNSTRAFPVLFIDNRLIDVDLKNYQPGIDDDVRFYRNEDDMINAINDYIQYGKIAGKVPVICAYNLMFDLKPLMYKLWHLYDIEVNAQSSMNVYTLDLHDKEDGSKLLRFWDTYHLEMRGLAAMGETAGLPKATGDWDYSLIRTPETELTEEEKFYAARDTQVIPAYLKYLLNANEWMKQEDLGASVLTKTSIVRQMARREIGTIKLDKLNGKKLTLDKAFMTHCKAEDASTFVQYALRKACFRGGFTFTSALYASTLQQNVVSLDVTSMHHTFINGRMMPEDFVVTSNENLNVICDSITNTSLDYVLSHYEQPFKAAVHVRVKIDNIRLKVGSAFNAWGIALEPSSKFKKAQIPEIGKGEDPRNLEQDNYIRSLGWYDYAEGAVFAFGKLYSADSVIMNLTELELWSMSRVYQWDDLQVLFGEASGKFRVPPDYVTLQSNELFEMKSAAKYINNHYREGEPYTEDLSGIPDGIAEELRNGTCSHQFFESWYTSTVKGMFNGIYGTQAQDVRKPSYKCDEGELVIDDESRITAENYDEFKPGNLRVLYTYGMRIVGGSRMHLVIALELLWKNTAGFSRPLGGDTDSIKVAFSKAYSDDSVDSWLDEALKPLADASKNAIDKCMRRVRKNFPDKASLLDKVGSFDIENRGDHYPYHMELWNKCRVSWDKNGRAHVTCAGLRRPRGQVNIENAITALTDKYGIEEVCEHVLGYNVYVDNSISHALEQHVPNPTDVYNGAVEDYTGKVSNVNAHESIALYPVGRWLGETLKYTNLASIRYMKWMYNREVRTDNVYISATEDSIVEVFKDTPEGRVIIMNAKVIL